MTQAAVQFAVYEQIALWRDLSYALGRAYDGYWSGGCESVAHRIVAAARAVGPTDPDEVPTDLLANGVYEALLTAAGFPVPDKLTDDYLTGATRLHNAITRATPPGPATATLDAIRAVDWGEPG